MRMNQFTNLTADESADFLRLALRAQIPFFFTKYGDGALECINGIGSRTCDHEKYSGELAEQLRDTWGWIQGLPHLYLGDWLSTHFDANGTGKHEGLYREFVARSGATWLHYDAVLFDRETPALFGFYHALKHDTRRKVIMGPAEWAPAVKMLNAAKHIVTPMGGVLKHVDDLYAQVIESQPEILLYGAGMAGTIPVIKHRCGFTTLAGTTGTYINLGSALDPLFRGKSRKRQITPDRARRFMGRLL